MPKIIWRPEARKDLKDIWRYTYRTWGVEQADRYLSELNAGAVELGTTPNKGRDRALLREGMRSININQHVVYYTEAKGRIAIVRVLHRRMDVDEKFED